MTPNDPDPNDPNKTTDPNNPNRTQNQTQQTEEQRRAAAAEERRRSDEQQRSSGGRPKSPQPGVDQGASRVKPGEQGAGRGPSDQRSGKGREPA